MATAVLHIDASPLALLSRRLGDVDADKRAALEAIGAAWESSTRNRFNLGQAPDGSKWKPSERVRRKGGKTLVLKGEAGGLQGSITYDVDGDAVEVGTNKVYGSVHQFGATIQRAGAHAIPLHLPEGRDAGGPAQITARPFLGVEADDWPTFTEILEGFVGDTAGAE
jgi:phage virion morphogenesis protein